MHGNGAPSRQPRSLSKEDDYETLFLRPSSSQEGSGESIVSKAEPLWSRWQSLAGVCLFVSVVGTTYAFGVYSQFLKDDLGFSQEDLDIVASIGNMGLYLSLLAGLLLEYCGLRFVVIGGGFLVFIGFLYIYLACKLVVPANLVSISIFFFLSQFGVCCHVSSCITYCVRLFPNEARGTSVGLGKGYFALSSAVLSDFAKGYFSTAPLNFVLFIAFVVPTIGTIGSSMANLLPMGIAHSFEYEEEKNISVSLKPFFVHWISLFITLFTVGLIQFVMNVSNFGKFMLATFLAVNVISITIVPSFYGSRTIPASDVLAARRDENEHDDDDEDNLGRGRGSGEEGNMGNKEKMPLIPKLKRTRRDSEKEDGGGDGNFGDADKKMISGDGTVIECYYGSSKTLLFAIQTWRFWTIYFMFFILIGCALMVIDNINAICDALNEAPSTFFVALISLANGAGRVTAGALSDHLHGRITKPQFLSLVCFLMAITQAMFATGSSILLYPCLLLTGLLFGSGVSLTAVCVADIFGGKYIATVFGMTDSASIFGSYVYVTGIVALFYRANSTDDEGSPTCIGRSCFVIPFTINAISCLVASIACYNLHLRTHLQEIKSTH